MQCTSITDYTVQYRVQQYRVNCTAVQYILLSTVYSCIIYIQCTTVLYLRKYCWLVEFKPALKGRQKKTYFLDLSPNLRLASTPRSKSADTDKKVLFAVLRPILGVLRCCCPRRKASTDISGQAPPILQNLSALVFIFFIFPNLYCKLWGFKLY